MGKEIANLYLACKGCKNWIEVKILMDTDDEVNAETLIVKCKYNIPETLEDESPEFIVPETPQEPLHELIDIKKCSMKESK